MSLPRVFENHLAFLASHRGTVSRRDGFVLVESTSDEFTCAFVEEAKSIDTLPERFCAVRLVPWSRVAEVDLLARGFERKGGFTYMTLSGALLPSGPSSDVNIAVVAEARGMDVFSEVQAKAFIEPGESLEWWTTWLRQKNHNNLGNDAQRFYIGSCAGIAAGVTLSVRDERLVGIYAVATLPEHRRKGVSTALLARAVEDARLLGTELITLQVKTGSYAEGFYRNLGFVESFISPFFIRPRRTSAV